METILSTPTTSVLQVGDSEKDAPDWDAIIDRAGPGGPLERWVQPGQWWQVVIGMHVKLVDVLRRADDEADKGHGRHRLLVFADTVDARYDAPGTIDLVQQDSVVIIARRLQTNATLHFKQTNDLGCLVGFYVRQVEPASFRSQLTRRVEWQDRDGSPRSISQTGYLPDPLTPQVLGAWHEYDGLYEVKQPPFQMLPMDFSLMPMQVCLTLLERMLFAAQWLGAQGGQGERALELLGRLQELLALRPDEPTWQALALPCTNLRELLQPVRFDAGQVPYLSASFYGDVARDHLPALQAYAGSYARLADRNVELGARKEAARRVLGEKGDAGAFQKLVAAQLTENLRLATANVKRAQDAIEPQNKNVRRAEVAFKAGLDAWREAKEREAAWAIAGAVFSFVAGVGSMFGGNGAGAADAAKAAADVASTAAKLAEIMKKLVKVGQAIEKIVKMCLAIVAAADKIADAGKFANDLSAISRESMSDDAKGAPSAGAYWDQLWVEVETQLAPAIKEGIGGAVEYLKELKILVIYGRALTTAQAALPPLIQEIARSRLQTEIAARQHEAVAREIDALKQNEVMSAHAMMLLWGNYRAVQRSLLVVLSQFDAAWRYWALDDSAVARDNYRGIADLAEDLKAVGDLRKMQARALDSFKPAPQEYRRATYVLTATERDAVLEGQRIGLRLTPDRSPLSGWGLASRVRVTEIHVWVEWAPGKRPSRGAIEFTVRTSGAYDDRRLVDRTPKAFHFHGAPVDLTFRYDLAATPADHADTVRVRAAIAEEFRTSYSEPTLYTDWIVSTPKVSPGDADTVDIGKLKADIAGIRVEFSGTYIKDPDRLV
ncbi:hypothetical protein [Montanilutibacter psychrotolerans]|uniref:Uncharacterized protein n=1 Tax=Montanilutibacter psychrotolerans TaxID=1327343 RepID=A0A3M8SN45_9GAMM|nr:hypothetical protein [Lysobacter psychrotolerans]RNF82798.1 hypothetical protein EER27_12855 [Lysobacter psychrotolerans]